MLTVSGIGKRLGAFALDGVDLTVEDGAYFVLVGASGVGKTVLLEIIAGYTAPDEGRIVRAGEDITHARIQGRKLGFVSQQTALFPHMTVRDNIAYGLRALRWKAAAIHERVLALAEEVGAAHLLDRRPGTLSGGEAQRVALARTLAIEPHCLLLDEPLAALDTGARAQMRALLRRINRRGQTVLHVTHDYEEALSLASRVAVMEGGRIVQVGSSADVFDHPRTPFVARFTGHRNCLAGRLEKDGRFLAGACAFEVAAEAAPGPGYLVIHGRDIVVTTASSSGHDGPRHAGTVLDCSPAAEGNEAIIDIGVEVSAMVPGAPLAPGTHVELCIKPGAARFIPG